MKNTAINPLNFSAKEMRHAIILTDAQFKNYQQSQMHIYSPGGEYLSTIGEYRTKQLSDQKKEQTVNQLALLECLVLTSGGELQLNELAVAGLAETLSTAQGFLGK